MNFVKNSNKNNSIKLILQNKKIIFIILLSILSLLLFKSLFFFILIVAIAAIINYFIHILDIHIHLGHVTFLAVIFSYTLGLKYGIFTILIAHIFAEIMAGHLDIELFITSILYLISCVIAALFNSVNIVTLGLGLTIFQGVAGIFLGRLAGTSLAKLITEDGVETVMLVIYYLSFAKPLINLIG